MSRSGTCTNDRGELRGTSLMEGTHMFSRVRPEAVSVLREEAALKRTTDLGECGRVWQSRVEYSGIAYKGGIDHLVWP